MKIKNVKRDPTTDLTEIIKRIYEQVDANMF